MRILLIGDYSGLHSALKKGLIQHPKVKEVVLLGDGDKFKNLQVDLSIRPQWTSSRWGTFFRKALHKVFRWDIAEVEKGWRAQQHWKQLKNFDVVQLINDRPIQTIAPWERRLIKQLLTQNKKMFLLSCGIDVHGFHYLTTHQEELSLFQPLFANPKLKRQYAYVDVYRQKGVIQTQQLILAHCQGIIASDMDYVNPNKQHPKYLGLIPHPVIIPNYPLIEGPETGKLCIFLGINRGNYHQKGIAFFEAALQQIEQQYSDQIDIIIAEQLPYQAYQLAQQRATIVLDQVFSKDQGYNALEAMAQGKVVFTGANDEFLAHYKLQAEEVCMEAKPDVVYLVEKLSYLIENRAVIAKIGQRAQQFVREVHDCNTVANQYVNLWNSKN